MTETVDIRALWDAAKEGDPRPPHHGGHICGQPDSRHNSWSVPPNMCTRAYGHSGQHVATTSQRVVAVWA
jgi:hypothetical protein